MKRFAMTIGALVLSACSHSTVLVNPRTGERVTCQAPTDRSGQNCVQKYEAVGFINLDSLQQPMEFAEP